MNSFFDKRLIPIILIIVIFAIFAKFCNSEIEGEDARYLIAEVYKIIPQSEGATEIKFRYYYKNKTRYGFFPIIDNWSSKLKIGDFIFYKYNSHNIESGQVVYGLNVPDSLNNSYKIWKTLPVQR